MAPADGAAKVLQREVRGV